MTEPEPPSYKSVLEQRNYKRLSPEKQAQVTPATKTTACVASINQIRPLLLPRTCTGEKTSLAVTKGTKASTAPQEFGTFRYDENLRTLQKTNKDLLVKLREQNSLIMRLEREKKENTAAIERLEINSNHYRAQLNHLQCSTSPRKLVTPTNNGEISSTTVRRPTSQNEIQSRARTRVQLHGQEPTHHEKLKEFSLRKKPAYWRRSLSCWKQNEKLQHGLGCHNAKEFEEMQTRLHKLQKDYRIDTAVLKKTIHSLSIRIKELENQVQDGQSSLRTTEKALDLQRAHQLQQMPANQEKRAIDQALGSPLWKEVVPMIFMQNMDDNRSIDLALDGSINGISKVIESMEILVEDATLDMLISGKLTDGATSQWKKDIKGGVSTIALVHKALTTLASSFQRIAAETRSDELLALVCKEAKALVGAQDVKLLLVDRSNQAQLWTKIFGDGQTELKTALIPSRASAYSEMKASTWKELYRGNRKTLGLPAPPGIAAFVATSGKSVVISSGKIASHPLYCGEEAGADNLIENKNAACVTVPVFMHSASLPIAVLQASGKLLQVEGANVQVTIETGSRFSDQDTTLLALLGSFSGSFIHRRIQTRVSYKNR